MDPEQITTDVTEAVRGYIEEGMAVLPAPVGEKESKITGWPQLVIGADATDEYFPPGETRNVTRVNGTNSGGRGDIDLDHPAALRVANYLVPDSIRRFGRKGILGHIEIRFLDHCPRTIKYELPGAGEDRMVVELRSDGSQTLLPPSTYSNGDRCVWRDGEVYEAHIVSIRALASDIAIAALLYMHYPGEGARHSFWLGAVGMLVRAKYPAERVRRIIQAVCRAANDPEIEDRTKVLDTTITKFMVGEKIGGKRQLKVAPEVPEVLKDWLGKDAMHDSDLPQIVVNDRPLREVSDAAVDALVVANDPPDLYARSGGLARLNIDNEGEPRIEVVDKVRLRHRMTRVAEFLRVSETSAQHVYPPDTVVADVAAAKGLALPELVGVATSPALRPDGTVLLQPGYDKATGLFYKPAEELEIKVPDTPTAKDVEEAVSLLTDELFVDFPFGDERSLANMIALLLSPVLRPAYSGPTPLALIDKPSPGTGATLLTEVVARIATGGESEIMSPVAHEEEARKQITATLMLGRPIIILDNVGGELSTHALSRALTSTTWSDRVLGHSKMATLPQRAIWIATGNHMRVAGDLPRRCYRIFMDAKMPRPWEREPGGFKHPDLLRWAGENRGQLLSAVLTICRNWFAAGKPKWSGRPLGTFEGWSTTVGGILEAAGIVGFLENSAEIYDQITDDGSDEWEEFLTAWLEVHGTKPLRIKDLVDSLKDNPSLLEALPVELAVAYAEGDRLVTRRFGNAFRQRDGVRYDGGLRIEKGKKDKKHKVHMWRVVCDDGPGSDGPGEGPDDGPEGTGRGRRGQRAQETPASDTRGSIVTGKYQSKPSASNLGVGDPADPADPAKVASLREGGYFQRSPISQVHLRRDRVIPPPVRRACREGRPARRRHRGYG